MSEKVSETNGHPRLCSECGAAGVPKDSDLCRACEIGRDRGEEARRRYLQEIGSMGGKAKARNGTKLTPATLGPLESHEDAMRWARKIAIAVACGEVSASRGSTLRSLLREWRAARTGHREEQEVEELKERMEALERAGALP